MHLAHLGADMDLVQVADDRLPLEEEYAGDQFFRMLHLVDGTGADHGVQPLVPPVLAHLGMDEILVDGGQLLGKTHVQMLDNGVISFHDSLAFLCCRLTGRLRSGSGYLYEAV